MSPAGPPRGGLVHGDGHVHRAVCRDSGSICVLFRSEERVGMPPPPQWLHERILTSLATGHNQIPQRPDRTHPRQPGGEPAGLGVGGGEPEALFADARDDQGQGVRGDCFDAKVNEGRQRGAGSWKLSGGQPASCRRCRRRGINHFYFCQSGMHRYVNITFRRQRSVGMLRVFFCSKAGLIEFSMTMLCLRFGPGQQNDQMFRR